MEENKVLEATEADFEGFDDGWDDETRVTGTDDEDAETDMEPEEEAEVTEEQAAESGDDENAEEQADEENETETVEDEQEGDHTEPAAEAPKEERFPLKHLEEHREVDRDEVIRLAQMGMDYKRIRERSEKYESFLKEMAGEKTIDELIDSVRAAKLAKETGIDSATALERVKLEREKKEFEARQGKQKEEAEAKTKADQAEQKRRESFLRFAKEYPDVKPQEIPKEVWKSVSEGMDLADAYALHENKQLRERVKTLEAEKEALAQNAKNKERTAGSRATAGKKKETDPFDDGWDAW